MHNDLSMQMFYEIIRQTQSFLEINTNDKCYDFDCFNSVPCKILGDIVYRHIFAHVDRNDLLSDIQHCFWRCRGVRHTCLCLLKTLLMD